MRDPKDITINSKQLSDILASHKKWLMDEGGERADLQRADLQRADLRGAYLQRADLRGAYLRGADLQRADLRGADLQRAYLQDAYLQRAYLQDAYLRGADLQRADLRGAYLQRAENAELAIAMVSICPEGDIIGWKKCFNNVIVKLLIPTEAKRSNATGRKCRAEFVKVLEVFGAEVGQSNYDREVLYKVGEIVRPDKWDDNRWDECSNGIHFFITRAEAEEY